MRGGVTARGGVDARGGTKAALGVTARGGMKARVGMRASGAGDAPRVRRHLARGVRRERGRRGRT